MKKGENLEQVEVVEVASTEKKIWNWLGKYGFCLLRLGLVLVLVWGAYLLLSAWSDCRAKKHANAYGQLTTLQSRVEWAEQAHPKALRNLQGFVFLENAHTLWDAGEIEKSILYFQKARDYLKISPLKEQILCPILLHFPSQSAATVCPLPLYFSSPSLTFGHQVSTTAPSEAVSFQLLPLKQALSLCSMKRLRQT